MRHTIHASNCSIEIINHPQDDRVYLNIKEHRTPEDPEPQIVLSRRVATALAMLISDD